MMTTRSLLALFAHPDDEAFGCGGTLAHYAAQGVQTALVCATRGEVGEISDPALATRDTLGMVREQELRAAGREMGLQEVIFLDYHDSGMAGTAENHDPRAFINIPAEEVVPRLVGIIRRLRPQVLLTFDPHGGYGHPDHIAIHHHTIAAFHAAADPTYALEQGAAWQPTRLYYVTLPRGFFEEFRQQLVEAGVDTSQFDQMREGSESWPDLEVTVTMDVSHMIEAKWRALHCHRTQFGTNNPFRQLPEAVMKRMMSRETFTLAHPTPAPGLRLPDLFAGL
jgi:LmbE family N-acetylglucosaminyl deacetylase